MNFDTRNNSALMKRAEQLRRWEESDTNREPTVPKNESGRKIKFSLGCVFLAACIAGDKDEVVRLLESGADINTANVDGLTALHQACIDDNLEMVEFLVGHGADINRQDNEGWTPLHATASCGFVSIARYLIENGADLTAINSDGELAIDLASTNSMADHLQTIYDENGIDCDEARQIEEQIMYSDAKKWLRSDASEADKPHPKTGATALHVAAAKGYTKVLSLLLAGRANVDKQDNDGWTPMHAAAHWGQKESIQMLVDAMADIDIKNYAGQTPIDVAESSIVKFLEEIKATNKRIKRRPTSQIRISDTIENHIEAPAKMIRVEVKAESKDTGNDDTTDGLERIIENNESDSDITDSTESSHTTSVSDNLEESVKPSSETVAPTPADNNTGVEEDAPWRRSSSLRSRTQIESPAKTQVPEKDVKSSDSEVILRRTQSFENDEKKTTVSLPVSPSTPNTPPNTGQVRRSFVPPVRDEESETQRKAHAKRVRETRRSTQGVTLDEIKSAEELVKKKNLNNNNNNPNFKLEDASANLPIASNNSTIITSAPAVIAAANLSSINQRRTNSTSTSTPTTQPPQRPVSAPIITTNPSGNDSSSNDRTKESTNEVTLSLRRNRTAEDKDNDKENDSRSAQATQAVIQRRRRPKRRSTGVVHLDMDDIDPDRQDSPAENDEKESGSERLSRSRVGSSSSLSGETNDSKSNADATENGEIIDYKALWEAVKLENEKLKQELKKKDDDLSTAKAAVERFANATTKNSLSELEKRERRAMERKLSEMEEELKQLQKYKTENERLRAENRALTRVVSKLTNSAQNQLQNKK